MNSELIELSRCRDADTVAEMKSVLDAAGIPCSIGSPAPSYDITAVGSGGDPTVIISVRRADFPAARAVMEEEYVKADLPTDHYLLAFSDKELAEVLGKPSEWSPFDVAHARKLAEARKIDPADIMRQSEERVERLRRGKPASQTLLFFGWLFAILGGWIGVGIAWSICSMKEKTPEGEFFTYDERSRKMGKRMFVVACIMAWFSVLLRIADILPI